MKISVASNVDEVARNLTAVQQRQIPFATSRALNAVAFAARRHIVDVTGPRDFDIRNRRFLGVALRVQLSTKRNLVARIYDRLGRDYLETQATGGMKNPRGNQLAVPAEEVASRRTGAGVLKRLKPRIAPRAFKRTVRGTEMILQRAGRRRSPLRVLYVLSPKAAIPKRFAFYEDARAIVLRSIGATFNDELTKALASAR